MRPFLMLEMDNFKPLKIRRTSAEPLENILKLFVVQNRLGYGLFDNEVFRLWDEVSGAGRYSSNKYFREGILHITLTSSLVRSQLVFQLDLIKEKMNQMLDESETVRLSGIEDRISKIVLH